MSAAASGSRFHVAFLDSNIIFSALHSPDGPPGSLLRHVLDGGVDAVVSRQVLDEVVHTFKKRLPSALPDLSAFLLHSPLTVIPDASPTQIKRWCDLLQEEDAAILAAAINSDPDCFVTGDKHFLNNTSLTRRSGLTICSAAQLLDSLA